jgi:hypothetical protein
MLLLRSRPEERVPIFAVEFVLTVRWPSEAVENALPTASESHRTAFRDTL